MSDVVERVAYAISTLAADLDNSKVWPSGRAAAMRALSALRPGDVLPSGLVVVGENPTDDMILAGGKAQSQSIGSWGEPALVWSAMLAAAKEPDDAEHS